MAQPSLGEGLILAPWGGEAPQERRAASARKMLKKKSGSEATTLPDPWGGGGGAASQLGGEPDGEETPAADAARGGGGGRVGQLPGPLGPGAVGRGRRSSNTPSAPTSAALCAPRRHSRFLTSVAKSAGLRPAAIPRATALRGGGCRGQGL